MIVGSEQTFGALGGSTSTRRSPSRSRSADVFQRESRATLLALDDFQANTRPLVCSRRL